MKKITVLAVAALFVATSFSSCKKCVTCSFSGSTSTDFTFASSILAGSATIALANGNDLISSFETKKEGLSDDFSIFDE